MIKRLIFTLAMLCTVAVIPSKGQAIIAGQPCGAPGVSAIATNGQAVLCQGSPLVWTATGGSGSGGGGNVGPVINVTNTSLYPSCFATVTNAQDWSACFSSISTAATTASYVSVGTPTIRSTSQNASGNVSSFTLAEASTAGDTLVVFVQGVGTITNVITVSDGTNTFAPLNNIALGGAATGGEVVWATAPGAAKAFTGNITVTDNNAGDKIGGFLVDAFNVGTIGWRNVPSSSANGVSTTPANTLTLVTQDNNNLLVSGISWFFNGATTVAANSGTLKASFNGTSTSYGGAIVTNQPATPGTATESVTVSQSSDWIAQVIELRSVQLVVPTVYFPAGTYNYTDVAGASPLNFTNPVTLKGDPGSWLCYMGSHHAIDMGPNNLTTSTYVETEFTVDGMHFTCGGNMSEGIYWNQYIANPRMRHNGFYDFGNAAAYAIYTQVGNYAPLLEFNFFWQDDNIKRNLFFSTDSNTLVTAVGNYAVCQGNPPAPAQCSNPGIGFVISGIGSVLTNNEIAYYVPDVQVAANNVKIADNYFEININAASAIVQFNGAPIDGLRLINNYTNSQSIAAGAFVGPFNGTSTLTNADVGDNTFVNYPAATPLVALNNLTGQVGNLAWHNHCTTTGSGGSSPCPLTHTAGGNITQWNGDYAGSCTMAAGVCPTYMFLATYSVAPKCTASWNGSGTLTGLIKVATTTATLIVSSTVNTDTGVMTYSCNPDAQ